MDTENRDAETSPTWRGQSVDIGVIQEMGRFRISLVGGVRIGLR